MLRSQKLEPTKKQIAVFRQEQDKQGHDIIAQLKTYGMPKEDCELYRKKLFSCGALDEQSDSATQTQAFVEELSEMLDKKIQEAIGAANTKAEELIKQVGDQQLQAEADSQRRITLDSTPENTEDKIAFYQNKLEMLNNIIQFLESTIHPEVKEIARKEPATTPGTEQPGRRRYSLFPDSDSLDGFDAPDKQPQKANCPGETKKEQPMEVELSEYRRKPE